MKDLQSSRLQLLLLHYSFSPVTSSQTKGSHVLCAELCLITAFHEYKHHSINHLHTATMRLTLNNFP